MSNEAITIDLEGEELDTANTEDGGGDGSDRGVFFLLARFLFAAPLGIMAMNHWRDMEQAIGYADAMDVPEAEQVVPAAVGMLSFGSLGIALWKLPTLASGAVAAYLIGVTPQMHRFWEVDEEQKQSEMINFLKNVALLGGALAFFTEAQQD